MMSTTRTELILWGIWAVTVLPYVAVAAMRISRLAAQRDQLQSDLDELRKIQAK